MSLKGRAAEAMLRQKWLEENKWYGSHDGHRSPGDRAHKAWKRSRGKC